MTWYRTLLDRARSGLVAHPRLFQFARRLSHLALTPRTAARRVSHAWQIRSFTHPQLVEVTVDGARFQIEVDPANGAVDEAIFVRKAWAPEVSRALRRLVAPGDTFVDVGANIGYFSLLASRCVGASGQVIAFEPLPSLAEQARRSARLNSMENIRVDAHACGAAPGTAMLFVHRTNVGASSLAGVPTEYLDGRHDVVVVTLDDALRALPRVDVIKIDVEGLELDVLRGACSVLATHAPILVLEISPALYEAAAPGDSERLVSLLEDHGYRWTLPDGRVIEDPRSFVRELVLRDRQYDVICLPSRPKRRAR